MSHSFDEYNNNRQKTMSSHVGNTTTKDFDLNYIDKQKNILTHQKQNDLGKIPTGIKRTSHSDPIQSTLYGFNNQEVDLGVNDTSIDKYHQYNPNYAYLNKNGLLRENVKYRLNTIQLNIDSSTRNIFPIVSYENEIKLQVPSGAKGPLSYSSLTTQVGISSNISNLLVINCPNHNFTKGDRFSMRGVKNNTISINTIYTDASNQTQYAVYFTQGSDVVTFLCEYNMQTTDNTNRITIDPRVKVGNGVDYNVFRTFDTSDLKVKISGFTGFPYGTQYIGNIPLNFLNGTHQMYYINPNTVNPPAKQVNIPDNQNPQQVIINGFYILLESPYVGTNPTINNVLTLEFNHYGGIPLNQLNAEFPVDVEHTFGYHEVFLTTSDTIVATVNNVTYYTDVDSYGLEIPETFGGDEVYISKITDLAHGYSSPNSYIINLPRSLTNVISVKLISTTFPNTSKIIRNTPDNNNNILYWQNQDDGEYLYKIALPAGNYTPESLKTAIEQQVYKVERKVQLLSSTVTSSSTSTTKYTNATFMNVAINTDTNIVTFKSYKEALLTTPIAQIRPTIEQEGGKPPYIVTIQQTAHGLKVGNSVLLAGFSTTMGIPDTVLNTTHTVVSSTEDAFSIKIDNFNLYTGTRVDTKGGYAAKSYVPISFRLLFNQPDTFGTLLGFRNVGDDTSITKFGTVINNSDAYEGEIIVTDANKNQYVYNKSGNVSLLSSNNIKLSGYDYILMSIEELNTTINLGSPNVPKYFAKINLSGLPGKILYDTFVPSSITSYDPIDINKLTIKFFAPDGTLFDFNGVDHSFVLEIMTEDHVIIEAGTVSNRTIF